LQQFWTLCGTEPLRSQYTLLLHGTEVQKILLWIPPSYCKTIDFNKLLCGTQVLCDCSTRSFVYINTISCSLYDTWQYLQGVCQNHLEYDNFFTLDIEQQILKRTFSLNCVTTYKVFISTWGIVELHVNARKELLGNFIVIWSIFVSLIFFYESNILWVISIILY